MIGEGDIVQVFAKITAFGKEAEYSVVGFLQDSNPDWITLSPSYFPSYYKDKNPLREYFDLNLFALGMYGRPHPYMFPKDSRIEELFRTGFEVDPDSLDRKVIGPEGLAIIPKSCPMTFTHGGNIWAGYLSESDKGGFRLSSIGHTAMLLFPHHMRFYDAGKFDASIEPTILLRTPL